MLNLIEKIHEKLDSEFKRGDLIHEGTRSDGLDEFKFIAQDPNNKFGTVKSDFVPTSYLLGSGEIQPTRELYHENGTIGVSFALVVNEQFLALYNKLEQFKRDIAGAEGLLDNGDRYVLNGTPISLVGNKIVNGVRVVWFELQVFYQISDKASFGNFREYEIRPLFDSYIQNVETLAEERLEPFAEPAPSAGLDFVNNGTFKTLVGLGTFAGTDLVIPAQDGGLPVIQIDGDFSNKGLTSVYFSNPLLGGTPTTLNISAGTTFKDNAITKIYSNPIGGTISVWTGNIHLFRNNNLSGIVRWPTRLFNLPFQALRDNNIGTFIIGQTSSLEADKVTDNPNLKYGVVFSQNASIDNPYTSSIEIFATQTLIDNKEGSDWENANIKPLAEVNVDAVKELTYIISRLNIDNALKEDLMYRSEYDLEFTEEEFEDILMESQNEQYDPLIRVESGVNIGTDVQATQRLGRREAGMIKGHTVFGAEFTIYRVNDRLNTDLDLIDAGLEPNNSVYILRLKEDGEIKYEREVMIETFNTSDEQGNIIYRRVVFRKADDILVNREVNRFAEEGGDD